MWSRLFLQTLGDVIPAFRYSHNKLDLNMLLRLAEDLHGTLERLLDLKVMFSENSMASMLGSRQESACITTFVFLFNTASFWKRQPDCNLNWLHAALIRQSKLCLRTLSSTMLMPSDMCRPELLLKQPHAAVPGAILALESSFPGIDVARVAERQPYWLVPRVNEVISELLRWDSSFMMVF